MSRPFSVLHTVLSSASRNSSGQSSTFNTTQARSLRFLVDVTVNTGSDSLDVHIEGSPDDSTWWILDTLPRFNTIKSNSNSDLLQLQILYPPKYIRVRYVVSGAITFSVTMDKKS